MRKLLAVLLAAVILTACSKEKKRCWGCVLVFSDGYVASYRDSMICDKSQGDINLMKKQVYDATDMGYKSYVINKCSVIK